MANSKKKAKEKEDTRMPRKDVYLVPVTEVREIKGSIEFNGKVFGENIRKDYGDIKLLAKQIQENGGIRKPCHGFKKDGVYYLTDGHRRFRAAKHILETTGDIITIPFLTERSITEEDRLFDMFVCNEGKNLNPVEQAEGLVRLYEMEISDADILSRTGFSKVYISNLKLLVKAPEKIRQLIIKDILSATLAMKILREEKSFDKAVEVIENAIRSKGINIDNDSENDSDDNSSEDKKSEKITDKDVTKSKGQVNSFAALKKALKKGAEREVRKDKYDLYKIFTDLNEGRYTFEFLMTELFEPDPEEDENGGKFKKKYKRHQATINELS